MPLIYVGVGILLMLFFLMVIKLDAFFSILITAVVVGLLNGMEINALLDSILSGLAVLWGKSFLSWCLGPCSVN